MKNSRRRFFYGLIMATDLTLQLQDIFTWDYRKAIDLSTTKDQDRETFRRQMTFGSGADQAAVMYHDRVTVGPASTTESLDIAGGLSDVFGDTITMTHIRAMMFRNRGQPNGTDVWDEADGEYVLIGPNATNGWGHWINANKSAEIRLDSGGIFIWVSPAETTNSVTAGTDDLLEVRHGAGPTQDVDIVIVGTTA